MKKGGLTEHETALVQAFILPRKQKRYLELLARPRRRRDALEALYHFTDLDERFAVRVATGAASQVLETLRARGAPSECHLISASAELDARTMELAEILAIIDGSGTLVSCIPGRLGYFEGERPDDRWILDRRADNPPLSADGHPARSITAHQWHSTDVMRTPEARRR